MTPRKAPRVPRNTEPAPLWQAALIFASFGAVCAVGGGAALYLLVKGALLVFGGAA